MNFSLLTLIIVLINPIFNCVLYLLGINSGSGQLQYAYITVFALVLLYIPQAYKNGSLENSIHLIIIIVITALLYRTTRLLYDAHNSLYESEFLSWGAGSIPAALCGAMFLKEADYGYICRKVPILVISLSVIISLVFFTTSGRNSADLMLDDATGLNYQSVSYYMAQFFGLSGYYLLFGQEYSKRWISCMVVLSMTLNVIVCLLTGGRGGLLLLLFFAAMFIFRYIRNSRSAIKKLFFFTIIILFVVVLTRKMGSMNIAGISRIADTFEEGDASRAILRNTAIARFIAAPLFGHGFGSVFYEIGEYSHNVFTDFLVESGIVGCGIFLLIIIQCLRFFIRNHDNPNSSFVGIVFISGFMLSLFSGYWLANPHLWFSFGYFFSSNHSIECRQ